MRLARIDTAWRDRALPPRRTPTNGPAGPAPAGPQCVHAPAPARPELPSFSRYGGARGAVTSVGDRAPPNRLALTERATGGVLATLGVLGVAKRAKERLKGERAPRRRASSIRRPSGRRAGVHRE